MRTGSVIIVSLLIGLVVMVIFFPFFQKLYFRFNSKEVSIAWQGVPVDDSGDGTRKVRIVNIIGKDAIPAILEPSFLNASQALSQMAPDELVLGVSLNGNNRAYPVNMLSRHEIVNDVVGGVPLAVTW